MNDTLIRSKYGKYYYVANYFDIIDTEEKAYWLGFLYADGAVEHRRYACSLCLKYSDTKHIKKLRDTICPHKPVRLKIVKLGKKRYKASSVYFSNTPLVKALIKNGCTPRKSLTLKFPTSEMVPPHLIRHFIRGYFDGDGSVYPTHANNIIGLSFEGTFEFLTDIQKVFLSEIKDYTFIKVCLHKGQRNFHMAKAGRSCTSAIFKYLYENATIWLPRKYAVFKRLLKFNNLPFLQAIEEKMIAELSGEAEIANPSPKSKHKNLDRHNAYKVKLYLENINFARGRDNLNG